MCEAVAPGGGFCIADMFGQGGVIILTYRIYVPYIFHIYFLNMFHIFFLVCFLIYGVKSRSGHDRSQSFGAISHASGPKLSF